MNEREPSLAAADGTTLIGHHSSGDAEPQSIVQVAHGMGSFSRQRYLLDHSDRLDGAVLAGSTAVHIIAAGIDPTAEVDAYVADPAYGFAATCPSSCSAATSSSTPAPATRSSTKPTMTRSPPT